MDNKNTISFLGDISLNDKYNFLYKKNEKPFARVEKILRQSDFVVGNLECLAQGRQGENIKKKPRLKTQLETLNYLKDINLDLVLLAHNHVYDNLLDGYLLTTNFLKDNNIAYIGAGLTQEEAEKPFIKKLEDETLCFLNYVTSDTNPNLPAHAEVFLNWFNIEKAISDIKKYKPKGFKVILCIHWGGKCEGGYFPDWDQPAIAYKLIEAGADMIVGGHSHTLQPFEKYKEKYIFYSLGNFCFSDILSDNKLHEIERGKRTESVILHTSLTNRGNFSIDFTPFEFPELHLLIKPAITKKLFKRNRVFKLIKSNFMIWKVYFLKHLYIDPVLFFLFGNNRNVFDQIKKINLRKVKNFLTK